MKNSLKCKKLFQFRLQQFVSISTLTGKKSGNMGRAIKRSKEQRTKMDKILRIARQSTDDRVKKIGGRQTPPSLCQNVNQKLFSLLKYVI